MQNNLGNILIVIALIVIAVYITNKFFPRIEVKTTTKTEFVFRTDTVKITKVEYIHLPAKIETLIINNQTVSVAKTDTVIGKNRDTVRIAYFFPPINSFDIQLGLTPREVQVRDKIVTVTNDIHHYPTFWDKAMWFGLGAGTIILLDRVHGDNSRQSVGGSGQVDKASKVDITWTVPIFRN